jgi:LmbE family N-acetylglucosaminyl deacetylase
MGTLVCFHAHPDDECIVTGGTIARAVHEGHRVVLVVATNGEFGEVPADLDAGETLADRRRAETEASAAVLGIHRIVWLGYRDSGMTGWPQNELAETFLRADLEEAAQRLASILMDESAAALTVYDWHGNYGHPDHIKVHKVGRRAAEIAETPSVFEATVNRDFFRGLRTMAAVSADGSGTGSINDFDPDEGADDGNPIGMPANEITHQVDVSAFVKQKRASMACHRSQISDVNIFLQMPDEIFSVAFGFEWFIKVGDSGPLRKGWLFE